MTDNLFQTDPQVDLPQIDDNKNYLVELVGEGKKYKDQEALAKANVHGTQTIELYKRRMDEMRADNLKLREENNAKAKLEDLITQLAPKQSSSDNTQAKDTDNKPAITEDQITSLVSSKVLEIERSKKEQENLKLVLNKAQEKLGANYQTTLKQQIGQLGLSDVEADLLAKKSPAILIKALGLDQADHPQKETFNAPPHSSQRNDNFAPSSAKKRSWSYYQELKKANPDLYSDRNTAVQMTKDAIELGEAFRDGTYYVKGLHDN